MTSLTRYFFMPVYAPRSAWSVIGWWESRRTLYNATLAVAGGLSIAAAQLLTLVVPETQRAPFPWAVVLVYAILANVCYSLGPAVDLFIRRRWGDEYSAVGPALFRYGFVFAVGLTLLPIPLVILQIVLRLLHLA
jgi:hypothetical protein